MPTKSELEQRRAEDRRRDAWLEEQLADCLARFGFTPTPEEEAEIADDLAHDRDGRTRAATALALREAARQLGGITWADVEGRTIVAQVEAWQIIEGAADRCAPADAGEDAGRKLRFYLHALAVRAELDGRGLEEVVSDAVFYLLAGDHAASEVWRRLDDKDGDIGLWVAVLLPMRDHAAAEADRDAAQALRRLRKVAWTYLRDWLRNAPRRPDHQHSLAHDLGRGRWREALAQTKGPTLAGALASSLSGDCSGPHAGPATNAPARRAAAEKKLWTIEITPVHSSRRGGMKRARPLS